MTVGKAGYTLKTIIDHYLQAKGVRKTDLFPGDHVFVKTLNSLYDIQVLTNGTYSVSGGWFDKKGLSPMTTNIVGCTWGGSTIKVDFVAACGLCLEFDNQVMTSTIQNVFLLPSGWQN